MAMVGMPFIRAGWGIGRHHAAMRDGAAMRDRATMRSPLSVRLPDPCLVVLVGAAGSGKSTFAARHFAPGEVLSSDAFRERIAGDPADQDATGRAFAALHRALARRLGAGRLTVVDATNVTPGARRALLERSRAARVPSVAIVLDLPASLVRSRNSARDGRTVPDDVVVRQLEDLATTADERLHREGFERVVRFTDPADVNAAALERATTPG
jgi:predicted kinase